MDFDRMIPHHYNPGWRMLEVRDGSASVVATVCGGDAVHPPPLAGDEVVAMRVEDGYMVVNQDANWNVVSAMDLAGRVVERHTGNRSATKAYVQL